MYCIVTISKIQTESEKRQTAICTLLVSSAKEPSFTVQKLKRGKLQFNLMFANLNFLEPNFKEVWRHFRLTKANYDCYFV